MTTSASPFTDQLGKGAWPIATFTYLLVYREQPDATKGDALLRFVWWAERPHFAPRNLLPPRRGRRHPSQHQSCHATKVLRARRTRRVDFARPRTGAASGRSLRPEREWTTVRAALQQFASELSPRRPRRFSHEAPRSRLPRRRAPEASYDLLPPRREDVHQRRRHDRLRAPSEPWDRSHHPTDHRGDAPPRAAT